jgi:hypothetical protein
MGLLLRIKLGKKTYKIDPDDVTLAESVTLKDDYGLENFLEFSPFDPKQMLGMLAISVAKADGVSMEDAKALVAPLKIGPIMQDINEQLQAIIKEAEEDPPVAANGTAVAADSSPAKTPGRRGQRKSTGSTASSPGK